MDTSLFRIFFHRPKLKNYTGIAIADDVMLNHAFDLNDSSGKKTRLSLWYTPGDDAYGLLTRSKRMVDAVDQLMEGNRKCLSFP
jgi:phytanoyl-CoA hydroxylase